MGTKFILEDEGRTPGGAEAIALYWLKMIGYTNSEACARLDITLDDYYRWYDTIDWFSEQMERLERALDSPSCVEEIDRICRTLRQTRDGNDFWDK